MKSIILITNNLRFTSLIALVLFVLTPTNGWGLEDKIVFVSKRNGTPEVFLVEGLDSEPIQLTRKRYARSPSISPDGTEVVFVSHPPGRLSNILKLHLAANRIQKLTNNHEITTEYSDLDWSPDGRKILFIKRLRMVLHELEKTELCVIDMKNRNIRHILQPDLSRPIFHPRWSPDSKHILFMQLQEFRKVPELFIHALFITDDNGNNVVEVRRDDQAILSELSSVWVPTWSPSRSLIAYIAFIPARTTRQIYSMNLDDESITDLTSRNAETKYRYPLAWSPDGSKILFAARSLDDKEFNNSGDIYVMDTDGENMKNLTQSPELEWSATWSPDGNQIAFSLKMGEGESSIFVVDENGHNQQRLTFSPGWDLAPHWSPDGKRIVFSRSNGEGGSSIFVMNANGQKQQRLSPEPDINGLPYWSPDGGKIAVLSIRDDASRIYAMNTNGRNVQHFTHQRRKYCTPPAWSPDGRWLAYGSGDERSWGIYLIDPQGDNETLITRSEVSELNGFVRVWPPTWSPDSQHLIYVDPQHHDDDVGLIKIDVDIGMPTHLNTDGLSDCAHPLWSPDGNSLLFSAFKSGPPSVENQKIALFLMNLDSSESRHFILPLIGEFIFKSEYSLLRLVWAPDRSQLLLSIGQTRVANQGGRRVFLVDVASESVRVWMAGASEADWVRPRFTYAVNPHEKHIATWGQMKKTKAH